MKALTFEELTELEPSPWDGRQVILKTKGKFGEARFWGIKETKVVFDVWEGERTCWSCPNLSTYGKTWVVYPLNSKPCEPLTITEAELEELNALEQSDNLSAYHRKLKKLFGIKAVPFTAYEYYLDDECIGNSYEDYPRDLLNAIGVEIER